LIDPSEANRMAHRIVPGILADGHGRGGPGVAALAGRLTRGDAIKLAHTVLDAMEKTSNSPTLGALGIALKGAAKQAGENPDLLSAAVKRAKKLARPPCEALAFLAGRNQLPVLVDLLKWPTCSSEERSGIALRIADLTGSDPGLFGRFETWGIDEPRFRLDDSKFANWASGQRYSDGRRFDLLSPPDA